MMANLNTQRRLSTRRASRQYFALFAAVVVLGGASCARSLRNPFAFAPPSAPDTLAAGASLDQIIAAVNANAQRIQSYQTNNATINIPGALGIPSLRGHLAALRPGRIRLEATTALTGSEVDLGSNDELFWFWVRRNEPHAVYFARHSQRTGSAAQQLMPIDPQWLLDAIGFAEFKPTDRHEGPLPIDKSRVEIKSYVQSPSGPMVKRTVVDATKAIVLEQHIYDGSGKLLASAIAKSHRYFEGLAIALPQAIEIRVPPAELAMSIDVGTVELNRMADNPQLWAMPTKPGSPAVDLGAQLPADPGGGPPTLGQQITGANWYDPVPNGNGRFGASPSPITLTTATLPPPAPSLPTDAIAGPRFVPPGGIAAQPDLVHAASQMQGASAATAQRLPEGGVTASSAFVR